MVTQASQLPPDTEFATKADLEQVVQTLGREFRSEIGATEQRFLSALEASEQRLRADFTAALEASEQRLRADFTAALEASEQRLRADFTAALEASEQRLRADFTTALEASEQRLRSKFERDLNYAKKDILLEIEKVKVTTLRWTYGGTIAIALGMIAAVVALAS